MTLQSGLPENFWDGKAVYLKGLHGWNPETWGCVGFTDEKTVLDLKKQATNPFIVVCYVTTTSEKKDLRGKCVGVYLLSHTTGDRDQWTVKKHHEEHPERWRYAFKAIGAFNFSDKNLFLKDYFPDCSTNGMKWARYGSDPLESTGIAILKRFTYQEVPVFGGVSQGTGLVSSAQSSASFTRGVAARDVGYWVDPPECDQRKELYILRLEGNTDHYLGRPALGKRIYKLGFSADPQSRLDNFNLVLPKGSFRWELCRRTKDDGDDALYESHEAALAGENAMKAYLKDKCDPLGGEFFLSAPDLLDGAWAAGKRGTKGGG